jgi:hypothetical protein
MPRYRAGARAARARWRPGGSRDGVCEGGAGDAPAAEDELGWRRRGTPPHADGLVALWAAQCD